MKLKNLVLPLCLLTFGAFAQTNDPGQVNGNFQVDFQSYKPDSLIGANEVPEKLLMNAFANINFTKDNFKAGIRYESYLNPMLGFDPRYKGNGIMYRYASYAKDDLEVTVGSFYEQFGSGLILRTYEERNLGYDNSLDGVRLKSTMIKGVVLKGFVGKQRNFFTYGPGILRGIDVEVQVNELLPNPEEKESALIVGGSFVSKFQEDQDPLFVLPENVASFAGRVNYIKGGLDLYGEYAYKINDPSSGNGFIYRHGEALMFTGSYSQKGAGIIIGAKRIDNMDYRTDRSAVINSLLINYLPALTKQHTYAIAAFYPYATQPKGEFGIQGEIFYKIPKGSKLGGKYGTQLSLNYSAATSIDKQVINDTTALNEAGTLGYTSQFFKVGDETYYTDLNVLISRKLNKKWKSTVMLMAQQYNKSVIEGKDGFLKTRIAVLELAYKIRPKHSIRMEFQGMFMKDDADKNNIDKGSWGLVLVEYTFAPHYFLAFQDLYNYGNPDDSHKIHYIVASAGYVKGSTRVAINYGKQRAGIFCVGGVCREVPASNGASVSITSSF